MKSYLIASAAIGALLSFTSAGAFAAEAADAAGEIDAIVVLGQGQSRQIQTVKQEELALEAAGASPLKALEKLPGVNVQSADAFGAYEWSTGISIRGFNQNQLGFTLDGVPLGDMSYGNHNGLHISRAITNENLGRVELAQGAGSLETASTSNLGGTLQFFSRDPSETFGGQINGTYGSESMHRVFLRLESGAIEPLGGLRAYASVVDQKADKWKGGSEQKQRQYDVKAVLPIGEGKLSAFYTRSERREQDYQDMSYEMIRRLGRDWDNTVPNWGLAIAAATAYNTGRPLPAPFATIDDAYYAGAGIRDDNLYSVSFDTPIGENFDVHIQGYGHTNEGQGLWYTPYLVSPGFGTPGSNAAPLSIRTTEYDIDRKGFIGNLTWRIAGHEISGGVWYEKNDFNQARRFYAETLTQSRDALDFQSNPFATQWQYAFQTTTTQGFLQDVWTVTDALKVNFGFKAVKVENEVATIVGSPLAGSIESEDAFLPQAGAVYQFTPDLEVFGGYTENMAAFVSAATSGPFGSQNQAAVNYIAQNLNPETSKTFEGGLRYRTSRFQGVIAAYKVDFNDRLVSAQTASPILGLPAVLSNVGSVETKGLEVAGEWRLTDEWSLYGAYSLNSSKYQDDVVNADGSLASATRGKTVVNTPRNSVKAELAYDNGGFYAKLSGVYADERYYTYENIGGKVDGALVGDLVLGYRFSGGALLEGLEVQANVTNLFNKDYISTVGSGGYVNRDVAGTTMTLLPAPPRQGFITIKKSF